MARHDTPILGGNGEQFEERLRIAEIRRLPDISGDERRYQGLLRLTELMTANGRNADEDYQLALREHREDEEFTVLVLKTLDALEESRYLERWALVQLAIDLEHPVAGDYLVHFVRSPIPRERSEDTAHGLSTVTEEVILRTTAIEGLARLFRYDVDSSDTLLDVISSSDYVAMRRAAWFALVDGGRRDALERARALLEEHGYGWIADLRRIPVQEAEQHDPRRIDPDRRPLGGIPAPYDD